MAAVQASIRGAFLSIFDEIKGRILAHQWPDGVVSAEEFNAIAEYVLPKPDVCGQLVSISAFGRRVLGFPVYLGSAFYRRNALHLNLCFVLDESAAAEEEAVSAVVAKLARCLITLEVEGSHLSDPARRAQFALLLPRLVRELNAARQCALVVDAANTLHLRLPPPAAPRGLAVRAHDVPVLVCLPPAECLEADFALRALLPFIDGSSHAAGVAAAAGIDLGWVLDVLADLAALGCARLLDWYCEHNVYAPTGRLSELAASPRAQHACAAHCRRAGRPPPRFRAVFALYCRMSPRPGRGWTSVADVCAELEAELPRPDGARLGLADVDVARCVQFGLLNGYLQRVHAYPRLEAAPPGGGARALPAGLAAEALDGSRCADELACALGLPSGHALARLLGAGCAWTHRADPDAWSHDDAAQGES